MALTEKYVSSLAGGAGNGLTAGSPFTLDQAINEVKSLSGTGGQGIRYNIKADGAYGPRGWADIGGSGTGTNTLPVHFRGYKTAIGDGYLGRSGAAANGALITTNMASIIFSNSGFNLGKWMTLESLAFTGDNGSYLVNLENSSNIFNCTVDNSTTNTYGGALRLKEGSVAWECDVVSTTTNATNAWVLFDGGGARMFSCRIIVNAASIGYGVATEHWTMLYGCLVKGVGGGIGIYQQETDRPFNLINCTITGWSDAIYLHDNPNWGCFMWGNMVTDNTGYAVNAAAATNGNVVFIGPNRVRANTLGNVSTAADTDWSKQARYWPLVTAAGSDYVNAATNDYNLLSTSPGRNQNVPKFSDMGAYGGQDPAGGGGAVFSPLRNFIIRPA